MRRAQVVGDNSTGKASAMSSMSWSKTAMRAILGHDDRWRAVTVVPRQTAPPGRIDDGATLEPVDALIARVHQSCYILPSTQQSTHKSRLTTDEATT